MKHVIKNLIFNHLLLVFILAGCSSGTGYHSSYNFPEKQWKRFDSPVMDIEISTPGIFYDMFVEIHFDASQLPKNFPVNVNMYTPSGEIRSRDLILDFTKKDDGETPGILMIVLRREFAFSDKGICKFEFENRSTKVNNPGIHRVSIILEKSQ